jgi:hypothetical protein
MAIVHTNGYKGSVVEQVYSSFWQEAVLNFEENQTVHECDA